jgi:hypothetical protein
MNAGAILAFLCVMALASGPAAGAEPPDGYVCLGTIRARHAHEIRSSNWSVGAETMDRDYTVYRHWRAHLGPLGVKKARIQSGWAKTERKKGVYDWAWLDEIIPDMAAQGVEPWVCLCYGNPVYRDGGGTGLGGALPSSPEALAAWDAFVGAFVDRYKQHVDEWEVWNEPRGGAKAADPYAALVIRTAQTIRHRQPKARILCMAGGAFDAAFVQAVLKHLQQRRSLHLVDEVTYHPYAANPDAVYGRVAQLRKTIAAFSDRIGIRQGENGAPSRRGSFGALSDHDWTETSQAKWALRRLLGDLGRDIPSSYFAICDMAYRVTPKGRDSDLRLEGRQTRLKINTKGLLAINPDQTVHHVKRAYRAVQHVTAIFDDTLRRIPDYRATAEPPGPLSIFAYEKGAGGPQVVTIWKHDRVPGDDAAATPVTFSFPRGNFAKCAYVDLLSGKVYAIPDAKWSRSGSAYTFRDVPVGDWPVLIADRAAIGGIAPAK